MKEFRKFIFHKHSCAIETTIDIKSMGLITNVSANVAEMFGTPADKVKGSFINSLMPDFIGKEHDSIMVSWAKDGTWRTIGKLKEIFCLNKEQHCFSALLYLKLYVRGNSLHFIANIFKINDCDYLVISPKGLVQGMGRKFLKVLGIEAKNVPLNLLIENQSNLSKQEEFEDERIYRRVFMGLKGLEDRAEEYK